MGASRNRVDLVGRDEEITSLRDLVDSAATLRGRIMVIEGESGIGKTRLVEEVLAYSKVREYRVFKSACEELERTLPFAAIGRALGADRHSPDIRLAAIGELLVGKISEEALPLSPGHSELRFRVLEEVIGFVEHSASVGPTVIVIEDVHWADLSSLLALRALGGRIAPLRVALLVTLRPTPRTPELATVLAGFRAAGADQRFLEPLQDDAVNGILTSVVGAMPGPRLRRQAAGAGGNPLYVFELATALVDAELVELVDDCVELREARLPSSLRQTIMRRLNFLSPATIRVLQMASILGSSFAVNDLSMCLKAPTIELLPSLEEALSSGVVEEADERLAFRHDLVRMVIYETLPAAVRKGLHLDVGRALAAAGRPPDEVAPHMILGASAGDQEAIRLLHRAARSIASRAPGSAVELLQRAVELVGPRDPLRDELITELVAALVWAGQPGDAEDLARAALNRPVKADVVGNLHWALAQAVAVQGRLGEALRHTEAAVGEPRLTGGRRARLMADAAQWKFYTGTSKDQKRRRSRQ